MDQPNIVFCVNARYAALVPTVIESILINTDKQINFFTVYSSITDDAIQAIKKTVHSLNSECICHFIEFDTEKAFTDPATGKPYVTAFRDSYDTFTRIFLTDLLEPFAVEKCLYLDVDLVVNRPLDTLLEITDKTEYATGVIDLIFYEHYPDSDMKTYVNAGVLCLNLANLKKIKFKEQCLECLKEHTGENIFDQDVINMVLDGGKIKVIDHVFNEYRPKRELTERATVIHYTGPYKPWALESRWRAKKFYWRMYHEANKITLSGKNLNFDKLKAKYKVLMKLRVFYNLGLKLRLLFPVKNSKIIFSPIDKP